MIQERSGRIVRGVLLAGAGAALWLASGAHANRSPAEPRAADTGTGSAADAAAPRRVGSGLRVTLEPSARPGEIVFRLANLGPGTLSVLVADTPLEPVLSADTFVLERSTKRWPALERAVYTGRLAKRVEPGAGDFVTLAPGQSRTAVVPLGRYYDAPEPDDYRVSWHGDVRVRERAGATRSRDLPSRPPFRDAVLHLGARGPSVRLDAGGGSTRARPAAFAGCDDGHRTALTEATPAAERLVADALRELEGRTGGALAAAPRYVRWFGPWTAAREARVRATYAALLDTLSGATLTYDCSCTDESLYAYVFPSRPGDVFLCPAFFRAGLLGTDSRAGTLVHELSHFPSIAGTHDHVYGHAAVAALARSDPALAVGNADSYEYFAENTPALAMEGGVPTVEREPSAGVATTGGGPLFTPLPLDAVVTGALGGGRLERFVAAGADVVAVDSIGGDADLYVFDDPSLDALVCASTTLERSGASEACRVDGDRTAYVVVHAYTDTRYAIRASGAGAGDVRDDGAVPATPPSTPAPVPPALPSDDAGGRSGGTGEASAAAGAGTPFDLPPADVAPVSVLPVTASTGRNVDAPSPDDASGAADGSSRGSASGSDVARTGGGGGGGLGASGAHGLLAGTLLLLRRRRRRA